MNIQNSEEKIILALDGLNKNEIINFLKKCPKIKWVKVGLELFCSNPLKASFYCSGENGTASQ